MNSNFNFAKTIFTVLLIFSMNWAYAQKERKLDNYKHTATLVAKNNKLEVTVDNSPKKIFDVVKKNGESELKNESDKKVLIDFLKLDPSHKKSLQEQYETNQDGLANKIVLRVFKLKEIKLINNKEGENEIAIQDSNVQLDNSTNGTPMEVLTTATEEASIKSTPILTYGLPIAALLAGIGIGYILFNLKNKTSDTNKTVDTNKSVNTSKPLETNKTVETKSNKEILETTENNNQLVVAKINLNNLEVKYNQLQHDRDLIFDKYKDRENFDKMYFEAIEKQIVNNFWESVNKKDEKGVVEFALKAAAHLTAISRLRLDREQAFDIQNIEEFTGNTTPQKYKIIDHKTNKDAIPDSIGTILSILKKHNINGLDNINFQGYTLNNLDS